VPRLRRPDGAEIEWRIEGEGGPLVAVALMCLQPPAVARGLASDLSRDHRVLTYDLRGTGASSRVGPYEIETDAGDLAALIDEVGGGALVVGTGDGTRRAAHLAAARPELAHTVVVSGELPFGQAEARASGEALSGSPAVLHAMLGLLESDYRTGLRSLLTSSGQSEWTEDALRERLDAVQEFCPPEAGVGRMRAYVGDDSTALARGLGDRLVFLHYHGNAWFQGSLETLRSDFPEARFEQVSEGLISSPAENAAAIRRIEAAHR